MALTFGTLLSSQGADAHHRSPFGSLRGNLCYATRSVSQCQTDLLVPRSPISGRIVVRLSFLMACPAGPRFGPRSPCSQNISPGLREGQIRGRPLLQAPLVRHRKPMNTESFGSGLLRHGASATTRTTLRLPTLSSRPATSVPAMS